MGKKARKEEPEDELSDHSDQEDEGDRNSESGGETGEDSGEDNGSDNGASDNDSDDEEEDGSEDGWKVRSDEEEPMKGQSKRTVSFKNAVQKKFASIPKKVAAKKSAKTTKSSKSTSTKLSKESHSSEPKLSKLKALKKSDRLEEARKAYKWWEAPKLPAGINWSSLEHAGVKLAPQYVRHNIPLLYDGKEVELTAEQEEVATFFAAVPSDGPQLGNPKTGPIFQKNFFDDFLEVLGPSHVIKEFHKLDFQLIRKYLDTQKNLRKAANDEDKAIKKTDKEKDFLQYGYALIDGRVEKMGNYNMEPPGLFRGRGEHPKTGKLKTRCLSEQVSLNLSEDACVPMCPMPGHAWQSIRHDSSVTWLCAWNENVQNQNKYVMLAASSSFKGKSDMDKYTKAIKLKGCIHRIRADYTAKIRHSKDRAEKQLGTAMWVIDVLALRVGGEKGEDEADTVGCCSLRCEHLTFRQDVESYEMELEFLGKDSMLFKQTIHFATHGDLGKQVYHALQGFCLNKRSDQDVFETLTPALLNKHLNSLMKGLTAKVFRTYNASVTLEKELPSVESLEGMSVQDKVLHYNAANRQVAILCNHQRTVSKATETMFENLQEKLTVLKDQRVELIK
jgi:DNA topoisomerase-1